MDLYFYATWNKISREDYGLILCVCKILNICINSHLYGIFVSAANAAILNTTVKTWGIPSLSQPSIPLSKVRRNWKCQGHLVLFHLPLSFFLPSLWSSLPSGDDWLPSFAIIYTHLRLSPSEAQPKPLLVLLDKPILLSSTMLPKYPKAPLERKVCGSEGSEHPRVSCSSFPKTQEILDLETI